MNQKLTAVEYNAYVGKLGDPDLKDITAYQKLIGKLLYSTIIRPNISFAVQTLSQFMQIPKQSHMDAALRVVKYIKMSTRSRNWAACPNTRRSVTGYIVKLGSSLISWKSKKQQTVSRSSAAVEYRSMVAVTAEVLGYQDF
ncbi:PREDICTED: uncharacterized protein LOC109236906 [Nicotiana attenuata]|uniref:uncharacterized protein LOC109236906 n=1 Tax=Nicotiana attenuata TaxID=49451 RepID=UPI00090531A1|nr:PREDICTED: uncharacterized protein LOC109236906 [Nicotiana attenuata]